MAVISKEAFSKATGISKIPMPGLASFLMKIMKIDELNVLIAEAQTLEGVGFAKRLLEILGISLDLDDRDLANIPNKGPFIVIANHPYGAVESLALLSILSSHRPDMKYMGNFLLKKIPNLAEYIIAVNPFEKVKDASSISGLKTTLQMLKDGIPVAIFPAGEVSGYVLGQRVITDKQWHPVVGKIISKANVPVVPVYFHGNNGILFSLLRLVHPSLQTAKLPSELFNKSGHSLRVRIGKPIVPESIPSLNTNTELLNYLRAKTYSLGAGLEDDKKIWKTKNIFKAKRKPEKIVDAISLKTIEQEINQIPDLLLCKENEYEVYMAPSGDIPNILLEIGRLREISFREVGEGTNKSIDLDTFDIYYYHLFLWDSKTKMLVGAYRIGLGDEIFACMKKKGFYISELFKIKKEFSYKLANSLELGRSWIRKEYQQKALPLFLLWKALSKFARDNSRYGYLIGPVSISNKYSEFSKSLMVSYIYKHHFDHDLANHIKPRKKFRVDYSKINGDSLSKNCNSLHSLNHLILEAEVSRIRIPVLLRQYLLLNGKIVGFNIDPKFNGCLDGFLILDVKELLISKIKKFQ